MAYAEGSELTVDEAVELLTDQPQLPANRQVIRALAELWVDYTLLTEAATQDSTLANVDVDALISQRIEQNMIRALREAVIQVDTVLDDDQLRFLYEQDQPGATVSARLHPAALRSDSPPVEGRSDRAWPTTCVSV